MPKKNYDELIDLTIELVEKEQFADIFNILYSLINTDLPENLLVICIQAANRVAWDLAKANRPTESFQQYTRVEEILNLHPELFNNFAMRLELVATAFGTHKLLMAEKILESLEIFPEYQSHREIIERYEAKLAQEKSAPVSPTFAQQARIFWNSFLSLEGALRESVTTKKTPIAKAEVWFKAHMNSPLLDPPFSYSIERKRNRFILTFLPNNWGLHYCLLEQLARYAPESLSEHWDIAVGVEPKLKKSLSYEGKTYRRDEFSLWVNPINDIFCELIIWSEVYDLSKDPNALEAGRRLAEYEIGSKTMLSQIIQTRVEKITDRRAIPDGKVSEQMEFLGYKLPFQGVPLLQMKLKINNPNARIDPNQMVMSSTYNLHANWGEGDLYALLNLVNFGVIPMTIEIPHRQWFPEGKSSLKDLRGAKKTAFLEKMEAASNALFLYLASKSGSTAAHAGLRRGEHQTYIDVLVFDLEAYAKSLPSILTQASMVYRLDLIEAYLMPLYDYTVHYPVITNGMDHPVLDEPRSWNDYVLELNPNAKMPEEPKRVLH